MRSLVEVIDQITKQDPTIGEHLASTRMSAMYAAPEVMSNYWREAAEILQRVAPDKSDIIAIFAGPQDVEEHKPKCAETRTVRQYIDTYRDAITAIDKSLSDLALDELRVGRSRAVAHLVLRALQEQGMMPITFAEYEELMAAAKRPITKTVYRKYEITLDPKPVPSHIAGDYSFVHMDYDGAPDGNDNRCGCAQSIADAKQQIDEQIEDREFVPDEAVPA